MIEQGDGGQFSGCLCSDRDDATGNRGGQLIDDQVYHQCRVEVVERGVVENTVDQPVVRSKRTGSLTASMTRKFMT